LKRQLKTLLAVRRFTEENYKYFASNLHHFCALNLLWDWHLDPKWGSSLSFHKLKYIFEFWLQSSKLSEAAYASQWYNFSTPAKRKILFIIMRANEPVIVGAAVFQATLGTFTDVFRSSNIIINWFVSWIIFLFRL
jgi:hypothetical protein